MEDSGSLAPESILTHATVPMLLGENYNSDPTNIKEATQSS